MKVEAKAERGDPRDVICETVEKVGAGILVMGSHGYGLIKRYIQHTTQMGFRPAVSKRSRSVRIQGIPGEREQPLRAAREMPRDDREKAQGAAALEANAQGGRGGGDDSAPLKLALIYE